MCVDIMILMMIRKNDSRRRRRSAWCTSLTCCCKREQHSPRLDYTTKHFIQHSTGGSVHSNFSHLLSKPLIFSTRLLYPASPKNGFLFYTFLFGDNGFATLFISQYNQLQQCLLFGQSMENPMEKVLHRNNFFGRGNPLIPIHRSDTY